MEARTIRRRFLGLSSTAVLTAVALVTPVSAVGANTDGAPSVPLASCHHADATMPTWGTPVFTPATVDVTEQPATVTVTVPVTDHGGPGSAAGMGGVQTEILGQNLLLQRASGDLWSATFVVPRSTTAGEHTLRGVDAWDAAGNSRDSFNDGLSYPELATPLTVIATPPPTGAAPTPTALTLSKKKVNVKKKARRVKVKLAVDETTAAATHATVSFSTRPSPKRVALTRTASGFAGHVTIPRGWAGNHKVRATGITLTDEYGRTHRTRRRAVKVDLGVPPVKVKSPKDKAAPKILRSAITPKKFNVRSASKKVTVTVRASDNRSGVKHLSAHLGPDTEIVLKKVRGTRKLGTWRGSVKVDPCTDPYRPARLYLQVRDRAGHEETTFGARFTVKANDVTRPRARLLHPDNQARNWPADGPVRLRFDERVTGVNSDSLVVLPLEGLHWGSPLAGTLECENASGSAVSCGSTKVREVAWVPAPDALPSGGDYAVMLNPDGNNDIRDRAGNPHRRSELGFDTFG